MQTYWDLTEKERSALTQEQVNDYIKYELMSKGVVAPAPFTPESLQPIELTKRDVYRVGIGNGRYGRDHFNCGFSSAESAAAFLKLNPIFVEQDYTVPTDDRLVAKEPQNLTVSLQQIPGEADILPIKSALARNQEIEKKNSEGRSAFDKAYKAVETATADLWSDYYAQQRKSARYAHILSVFDEYTKMAGSASIAFPFLCKSFPNGDEVQAAFAWTGRTSEIPEPQPIGSVLDVTA